MSQDLVLYEDRKLTMPFTIRDIGDTEAGNTRELPAYLANKSTEFTIVRIEYETFDEHVEVLGIPTSLEPREAREVIIKYSPSLLRQKPLEAPLIFKGKKRIPPE